MDFWKLHGTGNDFILIDQRDDPSSDLSALAKVLCDRRFGIGADGLIGVFRSSAADIQMLFYNADGSAATMCGNGIRCFAKYVRDQGMIDCLNFTVETGDGIKDIAMAKEETTVSQVVVAMGLPLGLRRLRLAEDGETDSISDLIFMHFGVPHAVIFVGEGMASESSFSEAVLLDELATLADSKGPLIEKDPAFLEGSNVNFVRILSPERLLVSTWERGAGRTQACGTGSCASAVAARYLAEVGGLEPSASPEAVHVRSQGGEVKVRFADTGASSQPGTIFLEGPACLVFKGETTIGS